MKKVLFSFMLLFVAFATTVFTSCSDDDDSNTTPIINTDTPAKTIAGTYTGTSQVTINGQSYTSSVDYIVSANEDGTINLTIGEEELKTTIGDIKQGTFTIKNIPYDTKTLSFTKNYAADKIKAHVNAAQKYDDDYTFTSGVITVTPQKDGSIKVTNSDYGFEGMPFKMSAEFVGKIEAPAEKAVGSYLGTDKVVIAGKSEWTYTSSAVYAITANADGTINLTIGEEKYENTVVGDITQGTFTIKNIPYDAKTLSFTKDYAADKMSAHVTMVNQGDTTKNKDYNIPSGVITVTPQADGSIKVTNSQYTYGTMPFKMDAEFDGKIEKVAGTYTGRDLLSFSVMGMDLKSENTEYVDYVITQNNDGTISIDLPEETFDFTAQKMGNIVQGKFSVTNIPYNPAKKAYYLDYSNKANADVFVFGHWKNYAVTDGQITVSFDGNKVTVGNVHKFGNMRMDLNGTFTGTRK